MTNVVELPNSFERKFNVYFDNTLLEYPTITRNDAGEWNYFDVKPDMDGAELARETLRLASRYFEPDGVALLGVLQGAHEVLSRPVLCVVAYDFIEEILDAALSRYDGLP